jgi:uncharacterized protein (TIGR03067 family)
VSRILPASVVVLFASVAVADDAAAKKILKELEGNYTASSITKGGEAAPDEVLKSMSFTIKGDSFVVRFKKDKEGEDKAATIVLQPDAKPIAIDLTPKDGPEAGKPVLGILKVEKETVTLCWQDRSDKAERPKEFTSTKENKQFLMVIKKGK